MKPLFMKSRILFLFLSLALFSFQASEPLRVFLIGDSTMADKVSADYPETGWGMPFAHLFNEAVEVQNHAYNGRSTKSFRREGRWAKVFQQIKKGDYVFIQFGHNDAKISDTSRYAPAQTDYRENLNRYIKETRSKGGIPVLLTSIQRRKFDSTGIFVDQHGEYPQVVREVAKQEKVLLIDLEKISRAQIEKLGPELSKKIYLHYPAGIFKKFMKGVTDDTHFSVYGASWMAQAVASAIFDSNEALRSFLKKSTFSQKYQYELPLVAGTAFKKDTFSIVSYGATSSPTFLNTSAIQQAIDLCSAQGGGVVSIPAGFWLSGPISLKSNVNLQLEAGALLQFSHHSKDYPLVSTFWEGVEAIRAQSPISAYKAINIAISGTGIIDGAGEAWRPVKKGKLTSGEWSTLVKSGGILNESKDTWYPTAGALKAANLDRPGVVAAGWNINNAQEIKEFLRPNMISLIECEQILLEGVTFQNSPAWNIHPLLCKHLTVNQIKVKNPWFAQNGDGIDIESCEYVLVKNSSFDVGDDGICLKSGKDEEGRKRARPSAHIWIDQCQVFHGHGGVVVGSEMSGGVHDLFVSNCQFLGTDVGLRFKTARGRGGIVENVFISDILMKNIAGEAILFDMYYQGKDPLSTFGNGEEKPVIATMPVNEGTPQFRSIWVEKVRVKGAATGLLIRGLPEMPIKQIKLQDIQIECEQAYRAIEAEDIDLEQVIFTKTKEIKSELYHVKHWKFTGKELTLGL
ncbi:GDSL family lipase [Aquirufa nivalisilvae]|nr:GDSL family lipase [Aquirufa nivalisilvae]